jgi:hypothetical protein
VCVLAFAFTFAACSSDQAQPRPDNPSTVASDPSTTDVTSAPATTRPATTIAPVAAIPGGCPSGVGVAAQSAEQAARCLFRTWEEADRTRAAAFASLDVVDMLFRDRWSSPPGTFAGCSAEPATGGQLCTFEHRGTRYVFDVRRSEGGWRVTQLRRP